MNEYNLCSIKDFYKGKKVLVTGHTGFKGAWLTFWLNKLGAEVYGYSLTPPRQDLELTLCECIEGRTRDCAGEKLADIRWYETLENYFKEVQPEVVFHLAAQPIVSEGYKFPRQTFETNVMGTVNVMECIRKTPSVKSAVIITTDKVYDDSLIPEDGYTETDPLNGFDPYSNSKSCADLATQCYTRCFLEKLNIPVAIFRAGNVIGGGDFAKNRIVPDFVRAWHNNEVLTLRNPKAVRPYQHVLEPLYAYLVIGATQYNDGLSDILNIGPDYENCLTTEDLIWYLSQYFSGCEGKYECASIDMKENPFLALNNKHMKENGLFPQWDIEDTAYAVAEWYQVYYNDPTNIEAIRKVMHRQIDQYCLELE